MITATVTRTAIATLAATIAIAAIGATGASAAAPKGGIGTQTPTMTLTDGAYAGSGSTISERYVSPGHVGGGDPSFCFSMAAIANALDEAGDAAESSGDTEAANHAHNAAANTAAAAQGSGCIIHRI